MSYIYCVKVSPDTKDDVNLRFRESDLRGELFATSDGNFYVCPQMSHKMWSAYPQAKELPISIDEGWDNAITDCIKFLKKEYGMAEPTGKICWQEIPASFRCPKMESFIREFDVNS